MKNILLVFIALTFLAACSQENDHAESHTHHHNKETELSLNNGERWEANPETNEGIRKMLAITSDYLNDRHGDLNVVHSELEAEFQTIIQECTMDGEAHDQLHHFLHPLQEKMAELQEGHDNAEEIHSWLEMYSDYFK